MLNHSNVPTKNTAGTGRKNSIGDSSPSLLEKLIQREYQLELISPGFLTNLDTTQVVCDLSTLTLKRHMHWWWRTMHLNTLSVEQFKELEFLIWGGNQDGTNLSDSFQLEVKPDPNNSTATEYNKNQIKVENRLEIPTEKNMIQGLFYLSNGIDQFGKSIANINQRQFFISEGSKWQLSLSIPKIDQKFEQINISPDLLLNQFEASLWLLSTYGGIGMNSDKGFGSLQEIILPSINSVKDCIESGKQIREACCLNQEDITRVSPLESCIGPTILLSKESEPWRILDTIGKVLQEFEEQVTKKRNDFSREFNQSNLQTAENTLFAPIQWSLIKNPDNTKSIQIIAFPSYNSPNFNSNVEFLEEFFSFIQKRFDDLLVLHLPGVGETIKATLLAERAEMGNWKASWIRGEMQGVIINSDNIPKDLVPGDGVKVEVRVPSEKNAIFVWKKPQ